VQAQTVFVIQEKKEKYGRKKRKTGLEKRNFARRMERYQERVGSNKACFRKMFL
jgi:hypothetical protein